MFNINKKFNFKKLILICMCFVFGLSLSGIFVWKTSVQKTDNVQDTLVFEQPIKNENNGNWFSLNWANGEDENKVQLVSSTTVEGEGFTWNLDNVPEKILGGTVVRITKPKKQMEMYTISFDANDDGSISGDNEGHATLTINDGYELNKIEINDKTRTVLKENLPFKETVEKLDPTYSGTLKFVPIVKEITYAVDFFYRNESGRYDSTHKFTQSYGVSVGISSNLDIFNNYEINGEDVIWLFKVDSAVTDADPSLSGIQYSPSNVPTMTFTFEEIETTGYFTTAGGKYFYKLIALETGSIGNFIDGDGQTYSDPTIIAYTLNSYSFKIVNDGTDVNGSTYWKSLYETLSDNDKAILKEKDVYGIKVSEDVTSLTTNSSTEEPFITEVELTGINKNTDYKILTRNGKAFDITKPNDLKYSVHNYGFELSGYVISANYSDGSVKYFTRREDKWSLVGTKTVLSVTDTNIDFEDLTFGSIAQYLEDEVALIVNNLPTVVLTPVWVATEIKIGSTNDIVTFGETYGTVGQSNNGQTFFCYVEQGKDNLIANSGVWNYLNLTQYAHDTENKYTILTDLVCLDNVYKVTLNGVVNSNTYKLDTSKTDFRFNSGTGYANAVYNYVDLMGGLVEVYNSETYPLIDNYLDNLNDYIEGYNSIIDGEGTNDHQIFKKVYYSTGTVASDVLTATNPTFHIYLANNRAVGNLPMFAHYYAQNIAWTAGGEYFETNHGGDFDGEFDGLTNKTTWLWSAANPAFTAKNVYALDLYYEDSDSSDGIYSKKKASWFGSATELTDPFTEGPTSVSNKLDFVGWMLNANTATEKYGYTVAEDTNKGTVTVSSTTENFSLTFEYDSKNSDGTLFYGLKSVKGNGLFTQHIENYPIVLARFNRTYDLVINNNYNIHWEGKGLDETKRAELYGAASSHEASGTDDGDFKKTSLEVSGFSTKTYPFQTSTNTENKGISFLKQGDMLTSKANTINSADDYYYVYNYGHYISGWKVSCLGKYFYFNGSTWQEGDENSVSAYNISSNINAVASQMDIEFPEVTGKPIITITPVWSGVGIKLMNSSTEVGTITYAANYEIVITPTDTNGQKFFCYSSGENLIAKKAVWNYVYLTGYTYTSHASYTLNVTPTYLNNIYKVALNGVILSSTYELEGTSYEFTKIDNSVQNRSINNWETLAGSVADYDSTTYPLVEQYISGEVVVFRDQYNSSINGDGTGDYEVFKKVYYSTGTVSGGVLTATDPTFHIYLAHGQTYSELPMFKHQYAQVIAWNDNASTKTSYKTTGYGNDATFVNELQQQKGEVSGTWEYAEGRSEFSAIYVYRLDLFYINKSGNYGTLDAKWFGVNTSLDLTKYNPTAEIAETNSFDGWMIDAEMAKNVYGDCIAWDKDNKKVTISVENQFSLTFTYDENRGKSKYHEYYYGIKTVQGSGVFTQTKANGEETEVCPIVTAKLGRTYDLIIDNSSNYWKNNGIEDAQLFGAVSSGTADGTSKTKLQISNKEGYEYPFQTSEQVDASGKKFGLSFYKLSDMSAEVVNSKVNTNYYYVYNYGHYITGWKISVGGKGFVYKLRWLENSEDSELADLGGITFRSIAELMDDYYSNSPDTKTIIVQPVWSEANIQVKDKTSEKSLLEDGKKFASEYSLLASLITNKPTGKSIIAFTYGGENDLIALSGIWNYYNKNNNSVDISAKYVYANENTFDNGEGIYTLTVEPVFVDNIYKVSLTNAKIVSENKYQLTNTDYVFNSRVGAYDTTRDEDLVSYNNKIDSTFAFAEFSSGWIDNYILTLVSCRDNYNEGIANGGFEIFRKVYYSTGTVATTTNTNDTLNVTTNPTFWIYLANNQHTGNLPVFEKEYYPLIFWQNTLHADKSECVGIGVCSNPQHYIYKTEIFEDVHNQEIEGKYLCRDGEEKDIWQLVDGANGNKVTLHAYYYRKYYNVEISTLVNEVTERRGYVTVDIVDTLYAEDNTIEDTGAKYIVIAEYVNAENRNVMKVYKVDELGNSLITYDNVTSQTGALTNAIKLYEGCDITISVKDQSKDTVAMASGDYDEMIGYKFSKDIDQITPKTDNVLTVTSDEYVYSATSDAVGEKEYDAGSLIQIKVYFEKIYYNMNFAIDNAMSGEFNLQVNELYTGYKTSYKLNNVTVDNFYEITYFAFAGYKLQSDAFKYANGITTENVLQTYDDATGVSQVYTLTKTQDNKFNGTWLREWFYGSLTSYDVEVVNLGTITIQTDVIEFNYAVKIYDETDTTTDDGFIEIREEKSFDENLSGKFSLNKLTGKGVVNAVGSYLTQHSDGFYYYESASNAKYALISSRMYIPNNSLTTNNNSYRTYNFLLSVSPTTQEQLSSTSLAFMVTNYQDGNIIKANNRNLFIMLEVKPLYRVEMIVKATNNDSNNSERTTTLTNGDDNTKVIKVVSGNKVHADGYYADNDLGTTVMRVYAYTYQDLENTLSSSFDANKYTDVKYTLDNKISSLDSNSFTVNKDSVLTIEYIPKTLNIDYVYMLNGINVEEDEVAEYITQDKSGVQATSLKIDDEFTYSVTLINNDYVASIKIGNSKVVSTDAEHLTINSSYTVKDVDFELGGVRILVEIKPKNNARINIAYALHEDDEAKRSSDDNYGTFSVYVDNDLRMDGVESAEVLVVEERNVYVSLNLACGYSYVGIAKGIQSVVEVAPIDGKVLLLENFSSSNSGDYFIVVRKDVVKATLDTSNAKSGGKFKSSAYINGAKELTNLYVGASVEFSYEDQNDERLDYLYYTYNNGTSDVEVRINTTTFKITSEILELYPDKIIKFGLRTIDRYKFVPTVVGQQYLEEEVTIYYADGSVYEVGTYCDEGTELTFSVKPNGVSAGKFKYNITCNSDPTIYDIINKDDITIILNKDYNYLITIEPKEYQVTVNENVYNDISQVDQNMPDKVEENQVNNMNVLGQTTYNSETTLEFTRVAYKQGVTLDRELSRITIRDNDSAETIIIEFRGTTYVATINGVIIDLNSYGYNISNLTPGSNTVKLTYVTLSNIEITLDYKDYKVINGG